MLEFKKSQMTNALNSLNVDHLYPLLLLLIQYFTFNLSSIAHKVFKDNFDCCALTGLFGIAM